MCTAHLRTDHIAELVSLLNDRFRFHIVVVTSGFNTSADVALQDNIRTLQEHLPKDVLVTHFYRPQECQEFFAIHNLQKHTRPALFICEENPFGGRCVGKRAVLELGALEDLDSVKNVLASISNLAHGDDFIKNAKFGEFVRKLETRLGKYSGPVKDCLSIVGIS